MDGTKHIEKDIANHFLGCLSTTHHVVPGLLDLTDKDRLLPGGDLRPNGMRACLGLVWLG